MSPSIASRTRAYRKGALEVASGVATLGLIAARRGMFDPACSAGQPRQCPISSPSPGCVCGGRRSSTAEEVVTVPGSVEAQLLVAAALLGLVLALASRVTG